MDAQRQIDTRAIELAQTALNKIDSHEKVCQERWTAIAKSLGKVESGIADIFTRLWVIAGAVIFVLLGIVGFLLAKHGI